ncbi:MAG: polyphosphate polymerase domain-containing protein [Bacteroidota bacterium]
MRRELKYLVRESDRQRLAARIAPFVVPDPHASDAAPEASGDGRGYTVRSAYYDTVRLRDWAEKESGDEIRRKVRVRTYDAPGSSPVVLEIKRKENMAVWKDRAPMTAEQAAALLAGGSPEALVGLSPGVRLAAERFLYRLRAEHRRPTLLVTYDREPFVGRLDPSLRITFDRRLRVSLFPRLGPDLGGLYAERQRPVRPGAFILEVKFDRAFPSWMRSVVGAFGLRQQALSKYALGMEAEARSAPWRLGPPAVSALARP